ncbi:unnamed protein product [Heterobilharzia americana]|nr:unnamed protein product [Heterobilharzia americana]
MLGSTLLFLSVNNALICIHHLRMSESMAVEGLPPPREISPLIRTARWGLLFIGIAYGALRLSYLKKREESIFKKNKVIIEQRLKKYNDRLAEQALKSLQELARETGITPKD